MIILTDAHTYLLEKVLKQKGIQINNIFKFPNDLDKKELISCSESVLIVLSETFYQILIKHNNSENVFKEINKIVNLLKKVIESFQNKSNNIYIAFVPNHFLLKQFEKKPYLLSNSKEPFINFINSQFFNELSCHQNLFFLKGLDHISYKLSKTYFRFSSIYDQKNSNEICSQILEVEKYINLRKKKLIILDLDNTLWKGILEEVTFDGIRLDLSDPVGTVYNHVQRIFLNLKDSGFLLAICSKNQEEDALNALFNHPSSHFKKNDIISYRINWDEKSKNILDICRELNISPKDTIFVDDSDYECDEVAKNIEQISIFKVPQDIYNYPYMLLNDNLFITDSITNEDKNRTNLYQERFKREELLENTLAKSGTKDEWIKSLETTLNVFKLDSLSKEIPRVIQLFNRTNQFNISGNRYTSKILMEKLKNPNRIFYGGKTFDRIGSEGIVSILSIVFNEKEIIVDEFILSCRVFNRYIEECMLVPLIEIAIKLSLPIRFSFIDTGRNQVGLNFVSSNISNEGIITMQHLEKTYINISKRPININYDLSNIFHNFQTI